jgi:anti-anti-sigma factor
MPFEVQIKEEGKVLVAALSGQLDTRSAPQLEKALDAALAKGSTELLVDCSRLDFVTSAGLRVLLMTGKRLAGAGGKLALCALNPSVREVFEISGFAKLFPIHPAREPALEWLASNVKVAKVSHLADDLLAKKAGPPRKAEARPAGASDPERVALAAELLKKKQR